jgi:hypothetical protein
MGRDKSPLTVWRTLYTEEDITEIAADRRVLACIDAFQKVHVTYGAARDPILGKSATHGLRDLSSFSFFEVVVEIGLRIRSGKILAPADLAQEFPFAYEPGTRPDTDAPTV